MTEPLTPPECDCTDLDSFMLNVERLMASELVALSTHEEIAAALFLWCRAWKQKPAASLPDDERVMAAFSRLPLARFRKLRGAILRGFVQCSDGRFYHRVLAATAVTAYERKLVFQAKREGDAERLRKWRASQRETHFKTGDVTMNETHFVAEVGEREGKVGERKKKEERKSISAVPASKRISKNPLNGHEKDFTAFYAAFPKHVAKAQAVKAYVKALGKTDSATLLSGAQRYAIARAREDPQYTKNPATWLNAECWLDEAAAPAGVPAIDPKILEAQRIARERDQGYGGH